MLCKVIPTVQDAFHVSVVYMYWKISQTLYPQCWHKSIPFPERQIPKCLGTCISSFSPSLPTINHFHALCRREGELMVTAVRVCHILFGYILTSILGYNEELLIRPRRFAVRGCPLAYKTFNARLRCTQCGNLSCSDRETIDIYS